MLSQHLKRRDILDPASGQCTLFAGFRDAGTMSAVRCRCRPSISQALYQHPPSTGILIIVPVTYVWPLLNSTWIRLTQVHDYITHQPWEISGTIKHDFIRLINERIAVNGGYRTINSFSAGTDFRRQNLTSVDVRFWWWFQIKKKKSCLLLIQTYFSFERVNHGFHKSNPYSLNYSFYCLNALT